MGLEDIIPDDAGSSSKNSTSTRSRNNRSSSDDETKKIQGPGDKEKQFSKDRWKEIRKVIDREFEDKINEVLNNYSAEKRYDTVHQAALVVDERKSAEDTGRSSKTRCVVCGSDCSDYGVNISGYDVCIQHSIGQFNEAIDK